MMDECQEQMKSGGSMTESDLIGSFGSTENTQTKPVKFPPQHVTPTCSEVSTSILGSLESLALAPLLSEKHLSWTNRVSSMSTLSSCLESTTSSGSDSSSSFFSKPFVGDKHSMSDKKLRALTDGQGFKLFRRASSCDTSKGIDDIEDFEVDDIHDFEVPKEVHDVNSRNV